MEKTSRKGTGEYDERWCSAKTTRIIILFIDREPTTWPASNFLQIMVCSSIYYLAANNILLMRKWTQAAFLVLAIAVAWKWQIASNPWVYSWKKELGDRMVKQLLNSVIAKYRDLPVSRRSIICLSWILDRSPLTNYDILLSLVK